ncbi:hypothetical protein MJO28_009745 [Puccinia striiformis f. sp. tritici]|uniref:Uncharacterized protein n=2 Tax=Puccinia striiformis f. sp. tritici TaxID=168172 RepID=A0ACC0E997_9BASI|nr:hypothetical protein MJO28_009745 [Puccinia striiformis f. sp. tritici]KAI7950848.1 hypothetical protein MJO29_009522 [Puccinia striiformis f. sp. tritici]
MAASGNENACEILLALGAMELIMSCDAAQWYHINTGGNNPKLILDNQDRKTIRHKSTELD